MDEATRACVEQQLEEFTEAAWYVDPTLPRTVARLGAAQRQLGQTIYEVLDGPERALQRRLEASLSTGQPLDLIIRLRVGDGGALAQHPALGWQLQLLTGSSGAPLALEPGVTLSVQLGEIAQTQRVHVPGGRLRVLFMAYSPSDTEPVLDYEAEEEHILTQLSPFVEEHRLLLHVAEDGSLAELKRRLMRRSYDIVHLTGHGVVTDKGPRLLMEDENGARDDISPEQLLKVLRAGLKPPRLVVVSSCHSSNQSNDLPSLAAELIQGGIPCVVGWTRPVRDDLATTAAAMLYQRLCTGEAPDQAVARARQHLHEYDKERSLPTNSWATLQYLTRMPSGFAIDPDERPAREQAPTHEVVYRMLGNRMRVLESGFVGRRRELQALGRILRRGRWTPPGAAEVPVAGATVVGMKGQGKSCLVGRALERYSLDVGELTPVVLHGKIDEIELVEALRQDALRIGDDRAEALLVDASLPLMTRIERLLRHHWRDRRMVIVLDDFEQNLDIPGEGEARLHPFAAELLEVLVPICRDEQPKVLITTTASFAPPTRCQGALAEIPLGSLDGASIRKLWVRGQSGRELEHVSRTVWNDLCERLGRNARILDWARQLLGGKTPGEVRRLLDAAGEKLPKWKGEVPDKAKQDELAALFLRHMAFDEARAKVGLDALIFVERARVYEIPVPAEAFTRLTEGLSVSLERHLVALANLGLLEMGSEAGRTVYRVSSLVPETFDAPEREKWHGVAAEYWWKAADRGAHLHIPSLMQAWEHALKAMRQDIADQVASILDGWLHRLGDLARSESMATRHIAVFPDSIVGLTWAGDALRLAGNFRESRRLLEQGVNLTEQTLAEGDQSHPKANARQKLSASLHALACVLKAQGEFPAARAHLERSLGILKQVHGTEVHPSVAASLHELAGVLQAQGEFPAARAHLEHSLDIFKQVHGTEAHPDVATAYASLGVCLRNLGDVDESEIVLRKAQDVRERVYGTRNHYMYAETEVSLALFLLQRNSPKEAMPLLQHARAVLQNVPNHPLLPLLQRLISGPSTSPRELAHLALAARASRSPPPSQFISGLHELRAAGAPHDIVADYLEQVAQGSPPPPVPAGLPEEVAAFITAVRDEAGKRAVPE
ncbi:tetratricopeptide repeat protein [Pyxidicoccus sp. 3LG]